MTDLIGQQLGNYRLIRLLGQGGFASVYLGEHVHLGAKAAIKLLQTQLVGEDTDAFRKEAITIVRLNHPHIMRIFDFGIEGETPFMVMEYAPNGTIRHLYHKNTKVPLAQVVNYVMQVASALQYAHDGRIIHRDVKPENMLLNAENEVLLSDFGIATAAQSTQSLVSQDRAGTAFYMAPEQFRGKAVLASDQYSLAVVVYEWLCGTPPFTEGEMLQLGIQHLFEAVPPLHDRIAISSAVEEVVMKALAKDPKQRFPSVMEFANALAQAAQSASASSPEIIVPPPPSFPPDDNATQPTSPDNAATGTSYQVPWDKSLPSWEWKGSQPQSGFVPSPTITPKDPSLLQSVQSFFVSLLPTVNAPQGTKGNVAQGTTVSIWQGHAQEVYAVTWSPDGKYIASAGADKMIQRWEVSTTRKLADYRANGKVYTVACSPDRKYLVSAGEDKKIQLWDIATAREHFSYIVPGEVYTIAWSPDGKYIASAGADRILRVRDISRRNEICTFRGHTDWIRAITWSPNGTQIASAGNDQVVHIWDFTSHATTPIVTYKNHTDWVRAITWSPDGTQIASAGNDQAVHVWNAITGVTSLSYTGHHARWTGGVLAIAWSPDGKYIVSAGEDQTVHLWNPTDGKRILTYTGHSAPVDALAWSPDGQRIASGSYDRTVQVWQALGVIGTTTMANTQWKTVR